MMLHPIYEFKIDLEKKLQRQVTVAEVADILNYNAAYIYSIISDSNRYSSKIEKRLQEARKQYQL